MQTLVCFRSAILTVVRNSLRRHDFFALAIPNVLPSHHRSVVRIQIFCPHLGSQRFISELVLEQRLADHDFNQWPGQHFTGINFTDRVRAASWQTPPG